MQRRLALFAAVLILAGAHARGDDAKARKIVDRAIKAGGGAEALAKFSKMTWTEKGTYYGMGDGLPYTGTYAVEWPNRFRMDIAGVFIMVLDGDKGWVSQGGTTTEMSDAQLAEQKVNHYAGWVSTLLPLKGKAFKLAELGETKIDGKAAAGLKVSRKGHVDVSLFFDKSSGLLVRSEHRSKASDLGGKEVKYVSDYKNYVKVGGAQIPGHMLITRDGKKFVDATNHEMKAHKSLDKKLFAKP